MSDWSSDVCSADLQSGQARPNRRRSGVRDENASALRLRKRGRCACDRREGALGRPCIGRFSDSGRGHAIFVRKLTVALQNPAEESHVFSNVRAEIVGMPPEAENRSRNRRLPHRPADTAQRSEAHTSELQSLMRNSYAVFCLKKKKKRKR